MKRKQLEQCAWENTPASQRRDEVELTTMKGTKPKKLTGSSREVIVFDPSGHTPGTMEPFVPLWSLYNDELQQRCLFGKIPRLHAPYHRTRPDYTSSIEGDPSPPGPSGARKKKSAKQVMQPSVSTMDSSTKKAAAWKAPEGMVLKSVKEPRHASSRPASPLPTQ